MRATYYSFAVNLLFFDSLIGYAIGFDEGFSTILGAVCTEVKRLSLAVIDGRLGQARDAACRTVFGSVVGV